MKVNSTAVKARRVAGDSLQLFPTPPWATRALLEQELVARNWISPQMTAWDPCCGKGHMTIPLREYFSIVFASDVHDWGFGDRRDLDFTFSQPSDAPQQVDWLFFNPPFTLAEAFAQRALATARVGVAALVRLQWLEGLERYLTVWNSSLRPRLICPFAERVPMIEKEWDPEASSATAYMWVVWLVDGHNAPTELCHIRPNSATRCARLSDLELASPGIAAQRKKEREAAQ